MVGTTKMKAGRGQPHAAKMREYFTKATGKDSSMNYRRLSRGSSGRSISHTGGRGTLRAAQYEAGKLRMVTRPGKRAEKLTNTLETTTIDEFTQPQTDTHQQTARNTDTKSAQTTTENNDKDQDGKTDQKMELKDTNVWMDEEAILSEIDTLLNNPIPMDGTTETDDTNKVIDDAIGKKIKQESLTDYWKSSKASSDESAEKEKAVPTGADTIVEEVLEDSDEESWEMADTTTTKRNIPQNPFTYPNSTPKRRLQPESAQKKPKKSFSRMLKTTKKRYI